MTLYRLAPTTLNLVLFALILAGAGCRDREITSYTIPKEQPAIHPPLAATDAALPPATGAPGSGNTNMAGTPVVTASGDGLSWTAPAHWKPGPDAPMRKATYLIADDETGGGTAELTVTAFPGDVGGNLANVNRWRQQIQLPPIGAAELEKDLRHLDVGPLHIDVIELAATAGSPPPRVLGAIVPYEGATWFFKLTGPAALVARERAAFDSFLKTLRPAGPAAPSR
ncbi:hypothetical protein OpiT1DRAFT_00325 [Opitutaceae bacterium TAV1]|nr:hypothetical protein OpiT1DRAFT_00325 [Opitutaceae bacterium TAV1]